MRLHETLLPAAAALSLSEPHVSETDVRLAVPGGLSGGGALLWPSSALSPPADGLLTPPWDRSPSAGGEALLLFFSFLVSASAVACRTWPARVDRQIGSVLGAHGVRQGRIERLAVHMATEPACWSTLITPRWDCFFVLFCQVASIHCQTRPGHLKMVPAWRAYLTSKKI